MNFIKYDKQDFEFYDDLVDSKEALEVLKNLVVKLPAQNKQIIYLRFWSNCNLDEIAYDLKLTRKKVIKILEQSLSILRTQLIEQFYEVVETPDNGDVPCDLLA